MAYPLIIFGAGASYDYSTVAGDRKISPLTNNLVDQKFINLDLLKKFPGVNSLLTELLDDVRNKRKSFEQALTDLEKGLDKNSPMRKSIVALSFYLKSLFKNVSENILDDEMALMHQINNYGAIVNKIEHYCDGKACVVTFNYDSLFEQMVNGNSFIDINDYVNRDIKVIKPHGSHDWVYLITRRQSGYIFQEDQSTFDWATQYPDRLELTKNIHPYHEKQAREFRDSYQVPAIAIPLVGKEAYICPPFHVKRITEILPDVDRVLIVGWKAADPLLLELLKEHLPKYVPIVVVSKDKEEAKSVIHTIRDILSDWPMETFSPASTNFSGFMSSQECIDFFSKN